MDSSGAPPPGKSSTGLEENTAAFLAVLLTWVGALIFYLLEKDSRYVKFYALQELALSLGVVVLAVIGFIASFVGAMLRLPFVGIGINSITSVIYLICWVIMLVNAIQGKVWELPIAGKWCRKQAGL